MNNIVEQVKSKTEIVEVISSYTQLKKAGRHFTGLCPFHQEKSPSFVVSPERQMWYCFGACHEGGDVISFIMKIERIPFVEAVKELARRAGIALEDKIFQDREWGKREILYKINHLAMEYYHHILLHQKVGAKALSYLEKRTLTHELMGHFRIGYAPESWDNLYRFLSSRGYTAQDIMRAGLILQSSKNAKEYYDRFRGRIIFPILDLRDQVVGFSGRVLDSDPKEAKYINSPETEIYHKRESLYGLHRSKESIRKSDAVYIVEGEFDMLVPYQHGTTNTVAVKGSSVTQDQIRILKRFASRLILMMDADQAGVTAVERTIEEARKQEVEVQVVRLHHGKDPDEAVRSSISEFRKDIAKPVSAYDFLFDAIWQRHVLTDPMGKKRAADDVVKVLAGIENPVLFEHYLRISASHLDSSEGALESLLQQYRKSKKMRIPGHSEPEQRSHSHEASAGNGVKSKELTKIQRLQRYLLQRILQQEDISAAVRQVLPYVHEQDFEEGVLRSIFHSLEQLSSETLALERLIKGIPEAALPVFDELFMAQQIGSELSDDLEACALDLRFENLTLKLKEQASRESTPESEELVRSLIQERNDIAKKRDKRK